MGEPRAWFVVPKDFGRNPEADVHAAARTSQKPERRAALLQHLIICEVRTRWVGARGKTYRDLAIEIGMSETQLTKITRGQSVLGLEHVARIEVQVGPLLGVARGEAKGGTSGS